MLSEEEVRKYYTSDNLEDLYKLYHDVRQETRKASSCRRWLVIGGIFLVPAFFILSLFRELDFLSICLFLLLAAGGSILMFYILFSVFDWLMSKDEAASDRLKSIELRIKIARERSGVKYRPSVEDVIARGIGGIDLLKYYNTPDAIDDSDTLAEEKFLPEKFTDSSTK